MPLFKRYILILVGTFLGACNSAKTPPQEEVDLSVTNKYQILRLPDSLGTIEIWIPKRYDTSFKWSHYSDCIGCGWRKYRFQPNQLPIFPESGFMWHFLTDSVDMLTISHSDYTEKTEWKDKSFNFPTQQRAKTHHRSLLENAKIDEMMGNIKADTVQQINGIWFSIIIGEKYDSSNKIFTKSVIGTSYIRLNDIKFRFQLATKRNDSITRNFIKNSLQLLKTIKINNGI